MHACMHACIQTYKHTYIHTIGIYIHTICIYIYVYNIYRYIYMYTIYTYIYYCIYIYLVYIINTIYIHTCIHIYTFNVYCIQKYPWSPPGDGDFVATGSLCCSSQERIRQRDPTKAPKARDLPIFWRKKTSVKQIATCGFGSFGSAGFIYKGEHHYGVTSGFQIANPS